VVVLSVGRLGAGQDGEELADVLCAVDWVGEGEVGVDGVVVASSVALARNVPGAGQLGDDAVRGAFGDPDPVAEVAQPDAGIVGDANQDLGVVGQEPPTARGVVQHLHKSRTSGLVFHATVNMYRRWETFW